MLGRRKRAFGVVLGIAIILWIYLGFFGGLFGFHHHHRKKGNVPLINTDNFNNNDSLVVDPLPSPITTPMVVAVVSCGMRLQETLNMIKSAILFNVSGRPLRFVVITETNLMINFKEKLDDWLVMTRNAFTYSVLPLTFPEHNEHEWRNLFKPCAAQRLFLPSLLFDIDSVVYVDTDTLFLSPVEYIWEIFTKFNSTQMAGLAPEHEDRNVGWYNRFARHPFYGPMGINSGVMLMNLTRMREFKWVDYVLPLYKEYKLKITWGDQDLINILFYYHPDKLYVFSCEWNYRPDHCMYMQVCKAPTGVKILHGNRGYFHSELQPVFSAIYDSVEQYQLGTDSYTNFLQFVEQALTDAPVYRSNCGRYVDEFLHIARQVHKLLPQQQSEYYSDVASILS